MEWLSPSKLETEEGGKCNVLEENLFRQSAIQYEELSTALFKGKVVCDKSWVCRAHIFKKQCNVMSLFVATNNTSAYTKFSQNQFGAIEHVMQLDVHVMTGKAAISFCFFLILKASTLDWYGLCETKSYCETFSICNWLVRVFLWCFHTFAFSSITP